MTELTPTTDSMSDPLDRESIAALAYRLWQQRGCPPGSGEQDWLQAEALLRAASLRESEATLQAHAAAPFAAEPPARRKPRAAKAPKVETAPSTGGAAAAAPKTRVSRARPARPDA
jgi:hypothetical protein